MLYDNGEKKTCNRMEDEPWYSDYQSLLEFACTDKEYTVEKLLKWFNKDYQDIFKRPYANQEQLLRWCVFLTERHKIALPYSHIHELKKAFDEWNENSDQFPSDRLLTAINKVTKQYETKGKS